MNRRNVLKTGLAAGIAGASEASGFSASAEANHFYELRTYQLRNDIQPAKINDFFQGHFLPRMQKLGVGPIGCFNVVAGQITPSLILLIDYKSLAEMQSTMAATSDKEFTAAWRAFETATDMPYVRYESSVLKAFDSHTKVELPPAQAEKQPARLFELRTYESRNAFTLRNKVDMFNQEEIKIFRACGMLPVFFGEGVIGTRLPSLTYMLGYDNMAARDKTWDAFRANPDWARVRTKPGWTDPEAVSNIHSSFLRPTAYSQIR